MRDVSAGDGDVFDARADDVALGDRDDVSDAVPGVDDGARQTALSAFPRRPGGRQRQHSWNGLNRASEKTSSHLGRRCTFPEH